MATTKQPKAAAPKAAPQSKARAASGDERLVRSAAPNVRGDRGASEDAQRTKETGLLSDLEMENLIRDEFEQNELPQPPAIPGWHLCWLTTMSQYDTVQKRQRIGYQPVRRSEMPNFDPSNGQELARFEGFVTCNEMVLFKIEEARYQALMRYFHHKKPLEEEAGILAQIQSQSSQQDSAGKSLGQTEGDGISDLQKSVEKALKANPTFA